MTDGPSTLIIDHAAEFLGCSRRWIYVLIQRGHLQTIRTNGQRSLRVTSESLVQYYESDLHAVFRARHERRAR